MPSIFESVLRADDLLYCQFEFVNLAPTATATGAPQLKRVTAGPAHIVVRLPPQNTAEQLVPDGTLPNLPYPGGLAGPTRLTFRVPDSVTAVDYRLDALLAFIAGADLVAADALDVLTTAIEFPDRLLLVPQPSSRLIHRTAPVTSKSTAVTEIWHTTFRDPDAGVSARLRAIANPADRADRPFATPLTKADRDAIVAHSRQSADPHVIASSMLRLTALGATARLKSEWPPGLGLAEWEHQTELGRDRYVRTVEQGYLFPFGHRAAITTVTGRVLASHFPVQTAELVQKNFLTILDPERSYENLSAYPGRGREMPFVRARIASAPQQLPDHDSASPIALGLLLIDRAGNHIDCNATAFFFAPAGDAADQLRVTTLNARYQTVSLVTLNGQRVALAENDGGKSDTSLNVDSMTFGAKLPADLVGPAVPAFLPFMQSADARIPAIEQMIGTTDPTPKEHRRAVAVKFHDAYLRAGFDAKQVFVKFTPIRSLTIPAERAGGVAAPKFPGIDGLSRLTGPVAGVDGFVNGDTLNPETLIGNDSKLLGVIPLEKVIAAVTDGADSFPVAVADLFDRVDDATVFLPRPIITTVTTASGVETRFIWKPRISSTLPPPLANPSSAMQLILKGRITAGARSPASPPALEVQGKLTSFALSLLGLVTVRFDSVEFAWQSGSKVDVKPHVAGIDFSGKLAFVQKLQELLPTKSMSAAPQVQTQPDGVTVRYAIPIPSAALGVMTIENLALSSSVFLPFVDGKPAAVQFAMSQRDNPFQISVSIFGGTGFFSLIALTSANGLVVEAALEFGGIAELDLVVVKGGVHLLVGVYLSMGSEGGLVIEGHLRLGGYVDVLGLVSVSIEFFLALAYVEDRNVLAGSGRLTVGIKLLFYSDSFSFEIHREIPGFGETPAGLAAPPAHAAQFPGAAAMHAALATTALSAAVRAPTMTPDQWERYCRAFA